ncbi:Exportin-2 [Euphorbia peplus]|nr:Exportin-2 [Euphorbia peplus]
MEVTPDFLPQCFRDSLSPDPELRRAAEAYLTQASEQPNYALAVLRSAAEPCLPEHLRQAAALNFKNHLHRHWTAIPEPEKHQIKDLIVSLMLSSPPPRVQSHLSVSISLIGQHDFPKSWLSLLPDLVDRLNTALSIHDYTSINPILRTVNSLFKRFRSNNTVDRNIDLKYCFDNFYTPLLHVFLSNAALLDSILSNAASLLDSVATMNPLLQSQRLCCRIFYSLNKWPSIFQADSNVDKWMLEFHKYLTTSYPHGLAVAVDNLRIAVCESVTFYIELNHEDFKGYVGGFVSAICNLLGNVSQPQSHRLTVTAIKFFTADSFAVLRPLFAIDGAIPQVCQSIVISSVRLRDVDEELFHLNSIEFIRTDMEESDRDTRRGVACKLLQQIAAQYKMPAIEFIALQVHNLLSSYAANPATNWKDKDCAVYLAVSLAIKTIVNGCVTYRSDLVNVENFFTQVILPELQSQDVNGFPLLKAAAIRFFTVFRSQIPKPLVIQLLPDLVRFLHAESNVVRSYAAISVEKMLLVKDEGGGPRYTSADIAPFVQVLLNNLFNALKFPESGENQYIMRCIMRVLRVAEISPDIPKPCMDGLASILNEVCKNPKDRIFNHHLFESVAILVRHACKRDVSLAPTFEMSLIPSFEMILVNDLTEFFPYAIQLLAQLIQLSMLASGTCKINLNVQTLVLLLRAFREKIPQELNQEGRLVDKVPNLNLLLGRMTLN